MYKYGARLSPFDERDYTPKMVGLECPFSFPKEFIVPGDVVIFNQGESQQCVAYTLRQCREIQSWFETGVRSSYSNSWIYGDRLSTDYLGEGLDIRSALDTLVRDGIVLYSDFPDVITFEQAYSEVQALRPKLLNESHKLEALRYMKLSLNIDIKSALLKYGYCLFCLQVNSDFEGAPEGVVPDFDPILPILGLHGVTCNGWVVKGGKEYWSIINSWGTGWGDSGIGYIPMDSEFIVEAWSIINSLGPIEVDAIKKRGATA
jgi:C1A family cysteine protease